MCDIDSSIDINFESLEKEAADFYSNDAFKTYMKDISQYPLLSSEEVLNYYGKMRMGDMSAKQMLINSNLRLVVAIACKYQYLLKNLNVMDIIQEGNMGLMKAVEVFEPEKGALSTIATYWIRQAITRAIYNKDDLVRKPVHFLENITKYKKLITWCKQNDIELSDDEICDRLCISKENLYSIKINLDYRYTSLNQKINDEDETEYGEVVSVYDDSYDKVTNNLFNNELIAVLKSILTKEEYYILYSLVLTDGMVLEDVAHTLNISREGVRAKKENILKKVKKYMIPGNQYMIKKLEELRGQKVFVDNVKVEPISPDDIIKYLYIKDRLTDLENEFYKLYYFSNVNYSVFDIATKFSISCEEVLELVKMIKSKMSNCFKGIEFNKFKRKSKLVYCNSIYDALNDEKIIDYRKIDEEFKNLSFEDVCLKYGELLDDLTVNERKLLQKYFGTRIDYISRDYEINKVINLIVRGYKNRSYSLPISKLFDVYKKNKNEFTLEQQEYLECFLFHKIDRKSYTSSKRFANLGYFINKLEKMYYGIYGILDNCSVSLEEYLEVKNNHTDRLGEDRIRILDMYYGLKGEMSLNEIASLVGVSYEKIRIMIKTYKDYVASLYLDKSASLDIRNKEVYINALEDLSIPFTCENRKICKMFFTYNMSYVDISKETGLSLTRISNIITESIRKIDMYRFNIFKRNIYTAEEIKSVFEFAPRINSELNNSVIHDKFVEYLDNDVIMEKYNINRSMLNKIVSSFNTAAFRYKTRNVDVFSDDISSVIFMHRIDDVLSSLSKQILAYSYGIKCSFNQDGDILEPDEIAELVGLNKTAVLKNIRDSLVDVKLYKTGLLQSDLGFYSREQMMELIKDVHLPISNTDRDVVCYLYELEGYECKTLEELALMYEDSYDNVRRRYIRSILNIMKYKNNEIDGKVDYVFDIEPVLRYFDKGEQKIIIDYYKNEMTYGDIAFKYNLSSNSVRTMIDRIALKLKEIMSLDNYRGFDFEYAEEAKISEDLPFDGDARLVRRVYDKYFRVDSLERKSLTELFNECDVDYQFSAFSKLFINYLLAICKHKDGIKKVVPYSYEEIFEYYNRNLDKLSLSKRKIFERYFKRYANNINGTNYLSDVIIYELMIDNGDNLFDVSTVSKEEVLSILRKYGKQLPNHIRNSLYCLFDISERSLMCGKDINHVYRILTNLLEKRKDISVMSLGTLKND